MANKKAPIERKFVDADGGKSQSTPPKQGKEKAAPYRIISWVLWILAIAVEVALVLLIKGTLYLGNNISTYLIVGLIIDFILVVVAAQLWKKANRIDPASEADGFKFFVQNQLGVIMTLIAFFPLVIILLTSKDLDAKTKKTASIVAIISMILAGVCSVDFNPPSQEALAQVKQQAIEQSDGVVYWTRWGKSYHLDPNCQTLLNSEIVYHGTAEEAFEANRIDPCDFCALDK